jgi:carboxypeptidase C (cathepsin A)
MRRLFVRASFGVCLAIGLISMPAGLNAQDPPAQSEAKVDTKTPPAPKEEWSKTNHTITIGGKAIPYLASAGTTLLTNDAGDPTGLLYSVAYTRTDVTDPSTRPVAFLYNGGPGSATMWLHMGAFGPRRVATTNGAFTPPAPYSLVDNTESLLDKTDLVFIDAMGTGYSRAAGKGEEKDFYGVDEDAAAFAQFIVTYLSRNNRWNSPKFLIGESYGTFRSAVLGNLLQSRYNVHLNGIDLISSVLDLSTITFADGDDRVYQYYLPSYAAVAWYFKAIPNRPDSLEAFVDQARKYAEGDYALALFKGSALSDTEKAAVAKKLSSFTGLSEEYLMRANLRVKLGQFNAELMRGRGLTAGRIDARFTGHTFDLLTENAESDPEGPAVGGAFTALINMYNHQELKFGKDRQYRNTRLGGGWNWTRQRGGGGFPPAPNVQGDLAQAMITNPRLLVQVENGYYDMATPFFPTEFTMRHLGLPAELQKNVSLKYYTAGHMMYLQDSDRVALHDNVAAFIDRATKR